MKHNKTLKSRLMAGIGALFLAVYSMTDIVSAAVDAEGTEPESVAVPTYVQEDAVDNIDDTEDDTVYSEEIANFLEEDVPYEELSDEAKQFLSEENIPIAGYEEYPAEVVESLQAARPETMLLAAAGDGDEGQSGSSTINWDEIVDRTYVPQDATKDDYPIRTFDVTYSSDIIESNGKDDEHYLYRDKDFTVKYTVTLNTIQPVDAGNAVIKIPKELLKNRDGSSVVIRTEDGIALPMYTENPTVNPEGSDTLYSGGSIVQSNRTQFGYYIDGDNYVIVNYSPIKPGSTWFEVVYDQVDVFDVKDGKNNEAGEDPADKTWTLEPVIEAKYKFEKKCWVYVGNTPEEVSDPWTIQSEIKTNWTEYMSRDWENDYRETIAAGYDSFGGMVVFADSNGTYYAKEDVIVLDDGRVSFKQLYNYDENGNPVLKYHWVLNDQGTLQYVDTDGNWIAIESEPKRAIQEATKCLKGNDTYYELLNTETVNNQAVSVYTYYDSNGKPAYQKKVWADGTIVYQRAGTDGNGTPVWENCAETELPTTDWVYNTYEKNSTPLTGLVNTEAKLDTVSKKTGEVTQNVLGNLNSESQILSFIPANQRADVAPRLNLDENIYVLWEIEVKGNNCTQPFKLYLDEYTSYSTGAVDKQQNPITYTYFDETTGTVKTSTEGNREFVPGGEIVYIAGTEVSSIDSNYQSGDQTSHTYYYVGSAIDETDGENTVKADADLAKAGTTGNYSKKIKVVTSYPRRDSNSTGVAIDTIVPASDGAYVYIPYGAVMTGKDGTTHDLWDKVNQALPAVEKVTAPNGILADRKIVKQVLNTIMDTELTASTDSISPLIADFVSELAQTLPNLQELQSTFAGADTLEEKEKVIIECWTGANSTSEGKQIKKALQDYLDDILENHLERVTLSDNTYLQSYDKKTVYREVRNDVTAVVVPYDELDPIIEEDSYAVHQREDKEPNQPNNFVPKKTASGSKSGWIDIYDNTTDELFGSTFSFNVKTTGVSFEETHPRSSAYFYDNASYVHYVTADDILTAEPWGTDAHGNQLYGGSYVLTNKDYCYTAAKIAVNERTFNIVDESKPFGATTSTTGEFLIDRAGDDIDRDWHIYVSYDGKTWEKYTKDGEAVKITMEDYLADSANYGDNSKGKHVLTLDFTKDEKQPCRIKVEHNTIDHTSIVDMTLTAAIKKDSPLLGKPDNGNTNSLREKIYSTTDANASFNSEDVSNIDVFRMRITNYAGFYAENGKLSEDDNGNVIVTRGDPITDGKLNYYTLINGTSAANNTNINDADKLTGDVIPATAFGTDAVNVKRTSAYVDVSKLEKKSLAEKSSSYVNDLTHGRAHITYRIAGYEGYLLDKSYKDQISELNSYSMVPGANRDTIYIYDLLPPGVEFEGYSGSNEKPFAGYLTSKADITDSSRWTATDKIAVSAEVVSEDSPEWASWGGAENGDGRYLVKFTLTLTAPEDYDLVMDGNWFWGVGVQFNANVSWERYSAAKNTPNLAVYVTPTETIGKHDNKDQVYQDNGVYVPNGTDYNPFKNTASDPCKQDFNRDYETIDYSRMYAKSKDLGEIARASSTAIGKQVRSDADTYALFTDKTAVIKGETYTYNINVENQAGGAVSGIILYDWIDSAMGNSNDYWKGTLRSVDVSALRLNGVNPVVYCYTGTDLARDDEGKLNKIPYPTQTTGVAAVLPTEREWVAKGWSVYSDSMSNVADVKAIAIALYADSEHTIPYTLNGKDTLSYKFSMKAPATVNSAKMYALNMPNYCYVKVESSTDSSKPWVVQSDEKYYDDPGNKTVVLIGDRRILKVAKHVESNYSNSDDINKLGEDEKLEFTFRLTRYTGYYENDVWKQGDVPCANIQYRIFECTFKKDGSSDVIDRLGDEVDAGVIHTTNENGEFILRDGQCAVFEYVPSTANLVDAASAAKYDFDNYKIAELSKPFWYEFKSVDASTSEQWYAETDDNVNNHIAAEGINADNAYSGPQKYYKQTGMTVTNTYRPVIYISKDTISVPSDMPTTDGLSAEAAAAKIEAFNTFDYSLWLFEYPINRMTGEYFQNGDYDKENDPDKDGTDTNGHQAAWLKLQEYYNKIGTDPTATTGDSYYALINNKIAELTDAKTALETSAPDNLNAINQKQREINAWEKLKEALIADKAIFDAHIAAAGSAAKFFSAPQEDINGEWTGEGYLKRTVSDRLVMPISGYAATPSGTVKSFSNMISTTDERKNGPYLYTYTVGSTANIYSTPQGWIGWEESDAANRKEIEAVKNPVTVKVRAGTVVALPIYLEGGMMYSDFGIGDATAATWDGLDATRYLQRYCYQFQEDMDDKYWDDVAGTYVKIADRNQYEAEKSWEVQTPSGNLKQKSTLGAYGENFLDYDNNYRFKDIYLQKSVEPADHVPKGDETNSVEKTAFIYKVTRRAVDAASDASFSEIPDNIRNRMTWELWTRDEDGKLLDKQMIGTVNSDGMLLAPIANYTGASTLYTIKIRNAEVGYTYRVEEIMALENVFGAGYGEMSDAEKETAIAAKFPYVTYNAASNTFRYNNAPGENTVTLLNSDINKEYVLATEDLYAVDGEHTSGALKIYDNDSITASLSKVDMSIDNVYRLRDLTVRKMIIAKTVDPAMAFTMRVRRKDLMNFAPSGLRFYQMVEGEKVYLTAAQVKELQENSTLEVTDVYEPVENGDEPTTQVFRYSSFVPEVKLYDAAAASAEDKKKYGDTSYYYLEFKLKDGYYAEIINAGYEKDEYQIAEEDWAHINEQGYYIHLDPTDDANTALSAWKTVELADNTSCEVRNGDEGYMILSKTYVSDGAGDYDDYARSLLRTRDDHKVQIEFKIGEKNSGSEPISRTIPEGYVTISGSNDPVTDLSNIQLKDGQNVIIDMKGLCQELNINYNNVEYEVIETIPDTVRFFNDPTADVLYSVECITDDADMAGDKEKTSVDIQNQVTKYSSVIYKRLGGNGSWTPPPTIDGDLVLELRDGGGNNRQEGVKWIATGETFSRDSAKQADNHGITGADGKLTVHSFEGWTNKSDGMLTYYVKVYFNKTVECNLTRSDNAQVLEVSENLSKSNAKWGYLIGYETYGDADTYVSQSALEDMTQWNRKQDTIVNTVQTIGTKKVEVYKEVYNRDGTLTDEDKDTEFTFTVKQWINGAYVPAPAVSYTITGVEGTFQTGADGTFALKHGQTASLDLPLFCYWEITETGKGDYRLLVDDNGEIVYDKGTQYVLDSGLDGLAPDQTAADPATYNAQRAASGFTLHTDFNIRAGIPLGDPVVLRSGMWDDKAKDYNFVLYDKNNDVVAPAENYYTTQSLSAKYYYINTNDVAYAINPYSESNESKKLNSTNVPDGVIYGAYDAVNNTFTNPVWAKEGNASYSDVNSFWNPSGKAISIPEYIYYKHSDGKVYRHPVIGIGHVAFKGKTNINSITIPSTVQKIGDAAFYNCSNITSFTFDQSTKKSELLSISRWGLQNTKPAELKLPEGLIELGTNALKLTNNNNKIYLPTTLSHCANEVLPVHINNNNGLIEIKSGLNNANGILGDGTETGVRYKDFCTKDNGNIWNNAGDVYKPKLLIFDNITNIKSYFMTDRNNLMRKIPIWVFSTDPEGGHTIVEDSMCVRTNFEGGNNIGNKLFIWRSSIVGDVDHQGVIFEHKDNNNKYDDYGLAAKDNTFTIVLTEIESTNTAQVDLLKKRFELSYDESTGKWYYDTKIYKSNKPIKFEVKVYFKDDISNMTASQILSNAGVTTYDIDGRVTAILNECINRTTAPAYPAPPVHTNRTAYTYLAEALWLNDKKKFA